MSAGARSTADRLDIVGRYADIIAMARKTLCTAVNEASNRVVLAEEIYMPSHMLQLDVQSESSKEIAHALELSPSTLKARHQVQVIGQVISADCIRLSKTGTV